MAFVDCLDLYTNLIIFLNREVISWAILNANYNGKRKVATSVYFTNSSAFVHTSSRARTHTHTQTHMHTESSQHAEITPNTIIYNVCLMWFTSHLQSEITGNSFPPFCTFSDIVTTEENMQDCHDVADCFACPLLSSLLLSI